MLLWGAAWDIMTFALSILLYVKKELTAGFTKVPSCHQTFSSVAQVTRKTQGKLCKCVSLWLGLFVLNKSRFNSNTQKVKSANQNTRKAMPIHTTFHAGFEGRCQSAIHETNYESAESFIGLCDGMGSGIMQGSSVAKLLRNEQKIYERKKAHTKSERNA